MERVAFVMHVKDGEEEEYRRRHREVWPAVLAELERAGVRSMSVFMADRQLILYMEVEKYAEAVRCGLGLRGGQLGGIGRDIAGAGGAGDGPDRRAGRVARLARDRTRSRGAGAARDRGRSPAQQSALRFRGWI